MITYLWKKCLYDVLFNYIYSNLPISVRLCNRKLRLLSVGKVIKMLRSKRTAVLLCSRLLTKHTFSSKPTASEVLTSYLKQCDEPPWTSYFVKYSSVKDDQFGMSNFNWKVGSSNYQILRTGCFPYMKYHCSRRKYEDLTTSDRFMRVIKILNLGIPCLLYGLAATQLIRHEEIVHTPKGNVTIYFLLPEHKGSMY